MSNANYESLVMVAMLGGALEAIFILGRRTLDSLECHGRCAVDGDVGSD